MPHELQVVKSWIQLSKHAHNTCNFLYIYYYHLLLSQLTNYISNHNTPCFQPPILLTYPAFNLSCFQLVVVSTHHTFNQLFLVS